MASYTHNHRAHTCAGTELVQTNMESCRCKKERQTIWQFIGVSKTLYRVSHMKTSLHFLPFKIFSTLIHSFLFVPIFTILCHSLIFLTISNHLLLLLPFINILYLLLPCFNHFLPLYHFYHFKPFIHLNKKSYFKKSSFLDQLYKWLKMVQMVMNGYKF